MQIILLCGGSGKRLWPLSNGTRSKQFLKLLGKPDGQQESMLQRIFRQINESGISAEISAAVPANQNDAVVAQLGDSVTVVTEPERIGTFPAIALAAAYLRMGKGIDDDETIVVIPCDAYTGSGYFNVIRKMVSAVEHGDYDLMLMGIRPACPSDKFGYIIPDGKRPGGIRLFIEKPDIAKAEELIGYGAVWNGGVFAFSSGYMRNITDRYLATDSFTEFLTRYSELPHSSFDYVVTENEASKGVVLLHDDWEDLGSWENLSGKLIHKAVGNVIQHDCCNTTSLNELNIPMVCHGVSGLMIAASPDGILIADKHKSESLKESVNRLCARPMYEERRWGTYKVIDNIEFPDGFCALTKQLTLNPGCSISYQRHRYRDEVWTFINGDGLIVLDGIVRNVSRGDVINIPKGQLHALKALTPLTFIEVQKGSNLVEEDIERFEFSWP